MAEPNVVPLLDPQSLLPPLLACLPTAFASSRPPPALLTLLSPILRQRLQIFTSTNPSAHDSWIRLLCWDSSKTDALKDTIEEANFEPHPASGELEVGEIEKLSYKRFDAETLKGQIPLIDWSLTALYVWCTGSEEGDAWRLAELLPYDSDLSQDPSWYGSPAVADEKAQAQGIHLSIQGAQPNKGRLPTPGQNDDDDDYWAQYDNAPERTPARKPSVNPLGPGASDADYYDRYGDVQPAMDAYDPDEQHEELGQSTLSGDNLHRMLSGDRALEKNVDDPSQNLADLQIPRQMDDFPVSQPVPASPSSRAGSDTVARLERTAEAFSASEIAIKQHISYSVKSMYRLAKGAGIPRQEFEDMVHRELETLSLLDRED